MKEMCTSPSPEPLFRQISQRRITAVTRLTHHHPKKGSETSCHIFVESLRNESRRQHPPGAVWYCRGRCNTGAIMCRQHQPHVPESLANNLDGSWQNSGSGTRARSPRVSLSTVLPTEDRYMKRPSPVPPSKLARPAVREERQVTGSRRPRGPLSHDSELPCPRSVVVPHTAGCRGGWGHNAPPESLFMRNARRRCPGPGMHLQIRCRLHRASPLTNARQARGRKPGLRA